MKLLIAPTMIRHPKVFRLAAALEVSPREARGLVVAFWAWVIEYRESGVLSDVTAAELAAGADWAGDPEQFLTALKASKLVDVEPQLCVHDWSENQGALLVKRDKERRKKARQRANRRSKSARPSVPSAVPAVSPVASTSPPAELSPGDIGGTVPHSDGGTSPSTEGQGKEGQGKEGTGRNGSGLATSSLSQPIATLETALAKPRNKKPEPSSSIGLLMAKARAAKIPNNPETTRSYVEAWLARSDYTRVEQVLMDSWSRGKTVLEIQDHFFNAKSESFQRSRDEFPKL